MHSKYANANTPVTRVQALVCWSYRHWPLMAARVKLSLFVGGRVTVLALTILRQTALPAEKPAVGRAGIVITEAIHK